MSKSVSAAISKVEASLGAVSASSLGSGTNIPLSQASPGSIDVSEGTGLISSESLATMYRGYMELLDRIAVSLASVVATAAKLSIVAKTSAYTASSLDYTVLCDASGGAFAVTLPVASGVSGLVLNVKKTDSSANAVTLDGDGSETIDGTTTRVLSSQYDSVQLQCDGTEWHIL